MAKRRKNLGGFSWKRATGITRAKSKISRYTGIPMSKSGRQRKLGKMMGGCLLPIMTAISAVAALLALVL